MKNYAGKVDNLAVAVFFDFLNEGKSAEYEVDYEIMLMNADHRVELLALAFRGTEDIKGHKLINYSIELEGSEVRLIKHIEYDLEKMTGPFGENTRIELAFAKAPTFAKVRATA